MCHPFLDIALMDDDITIRYFPVICRELSVPSEKIIVSATYACYLFNHWGAIHALTLKCRLIDNHFVAFL